MRRPLLASLALVIATASVSLADFVESVDRKP
jgi:hypothetical protein